jgi:DNA-binding transcriptional MerR regulator/methylmalonyl-CoA mutase cobalamin-binding subunit
MSAQVKLEKPRHPMRIVVLRTGLTPDLLRAWERRYAVVTPVRSEGGQRLYSDEDVERLSLLMRAVNGGRAIGEVAKLPPGELKGIVERDAKAVRMIRAPAHDAPPESRESLQAAALASIERYDATELESMLRTAALRLGIDEALDGIIGPLLFTIGERWHAGLLRPAQEHVATAVIRRTLAWMMEQDTPAVGAHALVVATLAGQVIELGAMLVAAAASSHGWRVVYLGTNLPAAEIAAAAKQTQACAIALSFVYPTDDPAIAGALRELRAALPANTAILAGGSAAANYAVALSAIGATRLGSIGEFRSWLREASGAS